MSQHAPISTQRFGTAFGEPAPFFTAATDGVDNYSIEVAAGRWIVLMIFGSLADPHSLAAHATALSRRALFNDADAAFFGVSIDPADRFDRKLSNAPVGWRYFWDFDLKICRLYDLLDGDTMRPRFS